jgi:hypothetical protein
VYLFGKRLIENEKDMTAGLAMSLLFAKPQFALVTGLFLIVVKNYKALKGMIFGGVILGLASVTTVGVGGSLGYVELLKDVSNWDMTLGMRQEIEVSWRGLVGNGWVWWIAETVGLGVVISIWRKTRNSDLAWTALIVGTLLLAVHTNAYDMVLLSLPAAWWVKNQWGGRKGTLVLLACYLATTLTTILVDNVGLIQIGPIALFGMLAYLRYYNKWSAKL